MRPAIPAAVTLEVLRRADAGEVGMRVVSESPLGLRVYRLRNRWTLSIWTSGGVWRSLDRFTAPDGTSHDPWHYLYDEDHRADAHFYAAVRAFIPKHLRRWRLKAPPKATPPRRFQRRPPRVTKNGRRAFL